jgi:tetratricopeptide (TPR) repeat protein
LYVTPVAAFLIGFLLAAAPLEEIQPQPSRLDRTILSAALASAMLAVLLHNLIDFAIFEPGVWMTFWMMAACLVAALSPRQPDSSDARPAIRPSNRGNNGHAPPLTPAKPGVQQTTGGSWIPAFAGMTSGGSNLIMSKALRPAVIVVSLALLGLYCLCVWRPVWNATGKMQQAQRAISAGQFDQAHEFLDAAFAADPLSAVAPNLNGRLYMQQYEQAGRKRPDLVEKAVRCFRKATETNPADYKSYEKLAQAYSETRQWQQACEWYGKAAGLYPGCERLWFKLAQSAEQLGRTDDALAAYIEAVDVEESYQQQFRRMYPRREEVISRLGDEDLAIARKRIAELSKQTERK